MMHMLKATNDVPTIPDDVKLPLIDMKTFELMETKLAESTFLSAMIFNFCQDFHIILRIIAF